MNRLNNDALQDLYEANRECIRLLGLMLDGHFITKAGQLPEYEVKMAFHKCEAARNKAES